MGGCRAAGFSFNFIIISSIIVIVIMRTTASSDPRGSLCAKVSDIHLSLLGGDSFPVVSGSSMLATGQSLVCLVLKAESLPASQPPAGRPC